MRNWKCVGLTIMVLTLGGCKTEHTIRIEPIEVKPITLNINIRVQKELDNFFDFEKDVAKPADAPKEGASK